MNKTAGDGQHRRAANNSDGRVLEAADIARSIRTSWLTRYATEPAIRRVGSLLAIALFVLIGYLVFKELEAVAWDHVREALKAITWLDIAVSILATAVSYIALIGYDFLALRQVGQRNVPLSVVSITSFIAHSLSFSLGFGALTGGAVRLRLYGAAGLAPEKVVSIGILCALTFWLGLAAVTSLSLIVDPYAVHALTGAGAWTIRGLGIAIVLAIAGWIAVSAVRPIPQDVHGWSFPLPGAAATLNSVLVGTLDTVAAAFALWLLLPAGTEVSFAHFIVVFSVATAIGVASHVPGGLGVFEGLIVLGLPQVPEAALIASLVL
nr:hypothetical protein [Hyphomicrobium sp.]